MSSEPRNAEQAVGEIGPGMKLYVWKDVMCDYTCGMVCVLAHDLEEALRLFEASELSYGGPLGSPTEVVTTPAAFAVYGGG